MFTCEPLAKLLGLSALAQSYTRSRLKRLQLEEFKAKASPGATYYGGFYRLVNLINRALGE